jgi:hypothetical protein
MRTAVTSRIRSKPTVEGQRYLDLYVLQRDRFRWKRLWDQAQRSMDSIDAALRQMGFDPQQINAPQAARPARRDQATGAVKTAHAAARTIDLGAAKKQTRTHNGAKA